MLHAKSVIVRRGGRRILDEVSSSLIGGELVALMGRAGAGKSTLVSVLSGSLAPASGEVWLGGKPVLDWSARERAQRRAVLSPASGPTTPMTALQVVALGRAPHVKFADGPHDHAIAEAALAWLHCTHLKARLYPTLSDGERHQVQFARVLAQVWGRAETGDCYVFLDAPIGGLDLALQHQTLAVARQLARDGAAVLVVLHDLTLASQYCDRLLLLRAGKLDADGPPRDVLVPRLLETTFGVDTHVGRHPLHEGLQVVSTLGRVEADVA